MYQQAASGNHAAPKIRGSNGMRSTVSPMLSRRDKSYTVTVHKQYYISTNCTTRLRKTEQRLKLNVAVI